MNALVVSFTDVFFLIRTSHSISFTRAQGIPKRKISAAAAAAAAVVAVGLVVRTMELALKAAGLELVPVNNLVDAVRCALDATRDKHTACFAISLPRGGPGVLHVRASCASPPPSLVTDLGRPTRVPPQPCHCAPH